MEIVAAQLDDVPTLLSLYERARRFMAEHDNAYQWGHNGWPPASLIESDVHHQHCYKVVEDGQIVGVFYFDYGENPEPCYASLDGWSTKPPYGVIHRIASAGEGKGILAKAVEFALSQCPNLRIDTYYKNSVMLNALRKLGFREVGEVILEHDTEPRIAFEKTK